MLKNLRHPPQIIINYGNKDKNGTSGFLISSFRMEWRANRSSLNKTAIWAGAVNFNHPSMMSCPVYHKKERK